jgi:P-type Mg2+ transporter
VVTRLATSADGLSSAEQQRRHAVYGPNAIRSHGATPLAILWRQLRNPLLILLGAATVTSFLVGEHTDALIILGIVALSVGLGFFNEYRSERVVEALHASIHHNALAMRDGRRRRWT